MIGGTLSPEMKKGRKPTGGCVDADDCDDSCDAGWYGL